MGNDESEKFQSDALDWLRTMAKMLNGNRQNKQFGKEDIYDGGTFINAQRVPGSIPDVGNSARNDRHGKGS